MNFGFFLSLLKKYQKNHDDCDCDHQPTWLALALVVLPAVLPVLVQKIADIIIHYLFGKEEEEEEEEGEEEKEEELPAKKKKKKKLSEEEDETDD